MFLVGQIAPSALSSGLREPMTGEARFMEAAFLRRTNLGMVGPIRWLVEAKAVTSHIEPIRGRTSFLQLRPAQNVVLPLTAQRSKNLLLGDVNCRPQESNVIGAAA